MKWSLDPETEVSMMGAGLALAVPSLVLAVAVSHWWLIPLALAVLMMLWALESQMDRNRRRR